MTRPTLAAALLCSACLVPLSVHAQNPVEAITVTAARLPAPLAQTPDAYVVTSADIDRRQAPLVTDVLAEVPGVSISENGAFGGVSSLRLRGATSDKTLVLIDGVPVNDPSQPAGGFDFSSLDTADIERIEVLTGPQGSLWGSDAIGGVVSVATREPNGISAYAEGGSLTTVREGASLGQSTDRYAFGATLANYRTNGISKADARDGNTEPDSFNTTTFSANGRISFSDRVTLDARARYNSAGTEYDGFGGPTGVIDSNDKSQTRTGSGYVRLTVKDVLGFDQEVRADLMDEDRQYFGAFPFGALGNSQTYRWAATRQTAFYGLSLGYEHKQAAENTGDGWASEDANGYYAIGRVTPIKRLSLTVSVRRDDPQSYRGQTTGRAALSFDAGYGFTINGSWGQGFKAPSIYETTYPCFECTVLGPDKALKPERAEGWDAGLAWRGLDGAVMVQATYFDLRVRDQIDYLYPTGYLNLESVKSTGVEAGLQAHLPLGFGLNGSLTHDNAVDGTTGARLLKVPRDTGSASASWSGHGFTADVGLRAQSASPDVYGVIQPFTVGYATAAYALTKDLTLTARIENLADTHYQEAFGYGEPGRLVMVGLRWRP